MSFSTVLSAVIQGLDTQCINVEADISSGLPIFQMVGYLSSEVKEASDRVRVAIRNTGIALPPKRIIINLSPANLRKRGTSFDVPVAVALLASAGLIRTDRLQDTLFIGELSLGGSIQKVSGVLPIVAAAKKAGCKYCIVPVGNGAEGGLVSGIQVIEVASLGELVAYLNQIQRHQSGVVSERLLLKEVEFTLDYADVRGQALAKRATEVAVAGGHNIIYIGPPGAGKTMIAKRIPSIFPPLTQEESIEITKIYSVMGLLPAKQPLIVKRPFREVHHTATRRTLLGGGQIPLPGELTLANGGVLFLDELAEFSRPVLEALRQPLEEKYIRLSRRARSFMFPANVMLAAAMNPCLCGNYPDYRTCTCSDLQIKRYLGRISQPIWDRIDICAEISKVKYQTLQDTQLEEASVKIRKRVCQAREIQTKRYQEQPFLTNAQMDKSMMEEYCRLDHEGQDIMERAFDKLALTARTYHKTLKVARTIADLDASDRIKGHHLREALGYRMAGDQY